MIVPPQLRLRRFVAPIVVATLVLALTIGLWCALQRQVHERIMETTHQNMESFRRELQSQVQFRVLGVGRIAKRLEVEDRLNRDEWEETTELDRVQLGGFRNIMWIDSTFTIRWMVPMEADIIGKKVRNDDHRRLALALARQTHSPIVTRPTWLRLSHMRTVLVYAPVEPAAGFNGYISGNLLLGSIVRQILEHELRGYGLSLTDHGESLLQVGKTDAVPAVWHTHTEIPMYGTLWRLEVWPTPRNLAAQQSRLPFIVLVVGTVLAGLIAGTIITAQSARRAAQRMAVINARLKEENNARRIAERTAALANRSKSDFLLRMSHELRTPLNSVIGFAAVLRKNRGDRLTNNEVELVERIRVNGVHLLGLVNDLLDVSKIEAGHMTVEHSDVDLSALIRETVAQLDGQPRGAGVTLHVQLPATPVLLRTDPTRLRQVLVNLLGNAIKFTPAGSITVIMEADPATGAPVTVAVADTGIGIPPGRQERIFDPFEQGDNSTMRKYGGTGLGLSISRELCALLGYRLTVRSRPGIGSVFTIHFARDPTSPV